MKPFDPSQIKTFRTPKYTGITLSLLSMFVLTSMMVVWDKVYYKEEPLRFLNILCEVSLKQPLIEAAEKFKAEYNIKINLDFFKDNLDSNDGEILQKDNAYQIIISSEHSISEKFLNLNRIIGSVPLAKKKLVFATLPDSNITISKLADINDQNISLGYFDFMFSSGKSIKDLGNFDMILFESESELLNNILKTKSITCGILSYQAAQQNGLKITMIDELEKEASLLSSYILKTSEEPKLSFQFARFLNAPDTGQQYFIKNNRFVVSGDKWNPNPTLSVYCEDIYNDFIDSFMNDFKTKEGIQLDLLLPDQKQLLDTLISISQSQVQHLIPDLLIVSPNTEKLISPNFIRLTGNESNMSENEPIFLVYHQSENQSLSKRVRMQSLKKFHQPAF